MSIYELVSRTATVPKRPRFRAYGAADAEPPTPHEADTTATAIQHQSSRSAVAAALSALAIYIPTEILTLYIFGLSIVPSVVNEVPRFNPLNLYLFCAVLTPLFVLLTHWATHKPQDFFRLSSLPIWAILSATSAYAVWALAIPGNGIVDAPAEQLIAGFGALLISFLLEAIGRLCKQRSN